MDSNFGAKGDEYMAKGDKAFKGSLYRTNIFKEQPLEIYSEAKVSELRRHLNFTNRLQLNINWGKDVN